MVHRRMFRSAAMAVLAAMLVGACGAVDTPAPNGGGGVPPGGGGAPPGGGGATSAQLAGVWLGPGKAAPGCGTSSDAFSFNADGTYTVQELSTSCGGFTDAGRFDIQGSTIEFHQTSSTAVELPQTLDYSTNFELTEVGGQAKLTLCDATGCSDYFRQ